MTEDPLRSDAALRAVEKLSPERRALLTKQLAQRGARREAPIPRLARAEGAGRFPASPGQERLYFQREMTPAAPVHLLPIAVRLTGRLDEAALEAALGVILDRHEALRTGFEIDHPLGLTQVVRPGGEVTIELVRDEVSAADVDGRLTRLTREQFDLAAPPLVRAALWRIRDDGDDSRLLVLCVHHIVVDGWSLGVLVEDLMAAYSAAAGGRRAELPAPPLQYADFTGWLRERLAGNAGSLAGQRAYWQRTLADPPMLALPGDRPRPAVSSFEGGSVAVRLRPALVARLAEIGRSEQATMFMVLLSAFAVLLRRWSGEDDLVIGTPVAGRPRPELDRLVGFFVNTLPLRIRSGDAGTFRDLLRETRAHCLEAFANQDVPFDQMTQGQSGRSTLVRTMLALRTVPIGRLRLPGLRAEVLDLPLAGAELDLTLDLAPDESGGLTGWLVYATDLFDRGTAERMLEGFEAVLTAVVDSDGGTDVRAVPVMSPHQHDLLTRDFSGSATRDAGDVALLDRFDDHVRATPDAVAVISDDDPADPPLTFRALDERANRLAHWLVRAGIGPEDRVALCLPRGPQLVVTLLAILKVGGVAVPLDTAHPAARLEQLVGDADPRMILCTSELSVRFAARPRADRPPAVVAVDALAADLRDMPSGGPSVRCAPGAAAYILYTSGSTGRPKGVVVTRDGLVNRLLGMCTEFTMDSRDVVLHKTPVSADTAMWELLVTLCCGGRVVLAAPDRQADPEYVLAALLRHRVTTCFYVPSMLRPVLTRPEFGTAFGTVRLLICAGEELSADVADRVLTLSPGTVLINSYGPTESTINVAEHRIVQPVPQPVPIGRPVPGADLYVLDGLHRLQPIGVPGELLVGGVQVARGYLNRPGQTADKYVPHPFRKGERLYRTGDRARWRPDGTLEFLGRLDDQVKIRGYRVEPDEVEAVLREHPAVDAAVVHPRPDRDGDLELIAYVTVAPGHDETPGADVLRRFLRTRLPIPMIPGSFAVVDAFPLTAYGKIDREKLLAADHARILGAEPAMSAPPEGDLQTVIAGIWAQTLDVSEVGVDDDFFDLGGHSMLATVLVSHLRELFRVDLPLHFFVEAPTIATLADLIRRQAAAKGIDADRAAAIIRRVQQMSAAEVQSKLRP